jgi:steroid 5-alpha reductase family enzyme
MNGLVGAALVPLAAAAIASGLVMAATWAVARRIRNAGIVDAVWSYNFTWITALFAVLGSGDPNRRRLMAVAVAVWSVRLGTHLAIRIASHHPKEDVRYAALREEWGANVDRRMFGFFELQALLNVGLSIPFLLVALDPRPLWSVTDTIAIVLAMAAVVGESAADRQLAAFKADPANRGRVCRVGLWGWSRHPNYFFEWLVWVAWAVFALPAPWGFLGLASPALMLFFLLRVTGIPMTEALSVKSRGDEYRRYQQEVSAFVPLPPRGGATA